MAEYQYFAKAESDPVGFLHSLSAFKIPLSRHFADINFPVKQIMFTFLLLSVAFADTLTAQQKPVIKEVRFQGPEKTSVTYLKKFIETHEGMRLDSVRLKKDAQYLSNIRFIMHADYEVREAGESGKVIIIFNCEELHTLLPIFNFGGLPANFWFRAGLAEENLLGRGIRLGGFYQYYDRHSFKINSGYPYIDGSNWGLNMRLTKWSTVEPLFFDTENTNSQKVTYNYDNYNFELTGTYTFSLGDRPFSDEVEFGGVLFRERYEKVPEEREKQSPGPNVADKNKFLVKVIYGKDHINHHYFYLSGFSNSLHLQTVFTAGSGKLFHLFFDDIKYYKRIGKRGNWANRLRLGLSTNRESPFAPFVLDNSVNIRGVGNKIDRGTATVVLNSEYRRTVYENNFGAIQGVGFADLGTWRQPGGTFHDLVERKNFKWYAGGGLRLHYKPVYQAILRVDYSVNLLNPDMSGFVIGLGQYF